MSEYCIVTYSGRMVDIQNPEPNQISITDIVHSLSKVCRSNGHSDYFYSVLQHLINCVKMGKHFGYDDYVLFELATHDTDEYLLHDLHPVLKKLLPEYKNLETTMKTAIYKKFNFVPMSESMYMRIIKPIDQLILAIEKKHNMKNDSTNIKVPDYPFIDVSERPMIDVRNEYLDMFYDLHKKVSTGGKQRIWM
ncbi:hypothetical protein [Brevibacillus sp. NRS-1366]|uniref:hypothetical protein n=1 Tax=Brevibacillus sp. NRS-1366 TaxID=3233899 RepID=UPI003D258D1C